MVSSTNGMETTSHPHAKIDLDTDLTLFPKINSKVEHRLTIKCKILKLLNSYKIT